MTVELSTSATLDSKETDGDRQLPVLADYTTAQRLAKQAKRDNVRQWSSVVDVCFRCQFENDPDLDNKKFREKVFSSAVAPLQRLYEEAQ